MIISKNTNIEKYVNSVFFEEINNLIVKYPIVWSNLCDAIYKRKKIVFIDSNILVIPICTLNKMELNNLSILYKVLVKALAIKKIIKQKEYIIFYLRTKEVSLFFKNEDLWLKELLKRVLEENEVNYEENNNLFLIKGKETNYKIALLNKDRIINNVDLIITSSTNTTSDTFKIVYRHNYEVFKKEIMLFLYQINI